MIKTRVLIVVAILFIAIVAWNHQLIYYGIIQAKGQLSILMDARPVEDFLVDPDVSDSLKARILLVDEIKKFANEELGLAGKGSYQKIYDQHGKDIMWVITACEPFQLKAKEWSFPIIGTFSYKGFFIYDMAIKEKEKLKKEGYDTGIRTAGAWSTLGVFNDPILSNILFRSPGSLAEVVIHEMTHATIFVRDSLEFNENLASFIGEKGAMKFLEMKYGTDSEIYIEAKNHLIDRQMFNKFVVTSSNILDSVYKNFPSHINAAEKENVKNNMIRNLVAGYDTISFSNQSKYYKNFDNNFPNNTFFMSFLRYRGDQEKLDSMLVNLYGCDFQLFIKDMKQKFAK